MMVSTMAQDIYSDLELRSSYVLSLINPTRTDPAGPSFPLNLREGIRACLQIREYLTRSMLMALEDALQSRLEDYNTAGTILLLGFNVAMKTMEAVQDTLDRVIQEGKLGEVDSHFEEEIAKFRETIPALEGARTDFQAKWPWHNESRLQESIAAARQGKVGKVAREAFREVRSRINRVGN